MRAAVPRKFVEGNVITVVFGSGAPPRLSRFPSLPGLDHGGEDVSEAADGIAVEWRDDARDWALTRGGEVLFSHPDPMTVVDRLNEMHPVRGTGNVVPFPGGRSH